MRIDVTKVKRAIRDNERLIKIAKSKNNGETPASLRRDHQHLIALRTGIDIHEVPPEIADCYKAQGFMKAARRAS